MKSRWVSVAPSAAQQHPLYGRGGWLLVLSFGLVFGFLLELGRVNSNAYQAGLSLSEFFDIEHPAVTFTKISLWANAASAAVICWALVTRQAYFRQLTSALFAGLFPCLMLIGALLSFDGLARMAVEGSFRWVISCALWISYLQMSRRVRVTFEHTVRDDDPNLNTMNRFGGGEYQSPASQEKSIDPERYQRPDQPAGQPAAYPPSLVSPGVDEDALYRMVADEIENGTTDKGLWTRLYVENNGSEVQTKVAYIRHRVRQLMTAELERANQAEANRASKEIEARNDDLLKTAARTLLRQPSTQSAMQVLKLRGRSLQTLEPESWNGQRYIVSFEGDQCVVSERELISMAQSMARDILA